MVTSAKIRKCELKINILSLHEEIFREIYEYLDVHTLWFTLREVCTTMKYYVDNYVRLSKTVILKSVPILNKTELYYFSTIKNSITSIHSKTIAPLPIGEMNSTARVILMRKGEIMVNGNIVFVCDSRTENKSAMITVYDPKQNIWTIFWSRDAYTDQYQFKACSSDWWVVDDSKLFLSWMPLQLNKSIIQMTSLNHPIQRKLDTQNTFISEFINLPTPLKYLKHYTLTKVSDNKVMIVGGVITGKKGQNKAVNPYYQEDYESVGSNFLWQGIITNSRTSIDWRKIGIGLNKIRLMSICFKLKDNLYIAGGVDIKYRQRYCCDRYNLTESKYYSTDYVIPDDIALYNGASPNCRIIINEEESIATIVTISENVVSFTENGGFKEVVGYSWIMSEKKEDEKQILFNCM